LVIEVNADHYRVLPSTVACAFNPDATASNARRNIVGNAFPRLSARRRMPAQAFGESEYFSGTFASKICDNEHATPSLCHSEPLAVQHTPRNVDCPTLRKRPENNRKISSSVRRESAGHVLPDCKARLEFSNNPGCLME
jgi:hypothetical protein